MKTLQSHFVIILSLLCLWNTPLFSQQGWDTVDVILQAIVPPTFPARDWRVTAFGADSTGVADCTSAFAAAIDSCTNTGGGRVVVPQGIYLTGAIRLHSNVNLYVAPGATIKFSTDPTKYLPVVYTRFEGTECMNYSPLIYAYGEQNIAVTGGGTLDGQATTGNWWAWKNTSGRDSDSLQAWGERGVPVAQRVFGTGHFLRPTFFQPYLCTNVLVQGVTFKDSPMWFLNPVLCQNVSVLNDTILTNSASSRPNTDGCDPESCTNVLIRGCAFNDGDDCIAIKSGRNADGRRVNVPCTNIVIQNCSMRDGHGGVTMGSEMSGGIRNVFAEDNTMDSPNLQYALRFKTNSKRGGIIENIYARRIQVNQVANDAIIVDCHYSNETGSFTPIVRNIFVDSMFCNQASYALYMDGLAASPVSNVILSNCTFSNITNPANHLTFVNGLQLNNVTINGSVINSVDDRHGEFPSSVELGQNYPNPFNPSTLITYQLPSYGWVDISVYDLLGREVARLVHDQKPAGTYQVSFDAHGMPSGVYFYRLKAGETSVTKRMVVIR